MPAHMKSILTGESLTLPVTEAGWRSAPGRGSTSASTATRRGPRSVVATLNGEPELSRQDQLVAAVRDVGIAPGRADPLVDQDEAVGA